MPVAGHNPVALTTSGDPPIDERFQRDMFAAKHSFEDQRLV